MDAKCHFDIKEFLYCWNDPKNDINDLENDFQSNIIDLNNDINLNRIQDQSTDEWIEIADRMTWQVIRSSVKDWAWPFKIQDDFFQIGESIKPSKLNYAILG